MFIPFTAIRSADANGVYLNVAKDDIKGQNWDQPPAETAMTSDTTDRVANTTTAANDVNVPVHEEHLVAGKQRQQVGDVHLRRDVTQERETLETPVTHEEVTVERRAGDDPPVGADAS